MERKQEKYGSKEGRKDRWKERDGNKQEKFGRMDRRMERRIERKGMGRNK